MTVKSFHYYGHRLLRQCILENDKELLTDYELCLAELAAAQSMAMLNYMDSLRGKGFPKDLQHEDDLPLTLEIHGQTAESLARVFTKLIRWWITARPEKQGSSSWRRPVPSSAACRRGPAWRLPRAATNPT